MTGRNALGVGDATMSSAKTTQVVLTGTHAVPSTWRSVPGAVRRSIITSTRRGPRRTAPCWRSRTHTAASSTHRALEQITEPCAVHRRNEFLRCGREGSSRRGQARHGGVDIASSTSCNEDAIADDHHLTDRTRLPPSTDDGVFPFKSAQHRARDVVMPVATLSGTCGRYRLEESTVRRFAR